MQRVRNSDLITETIPIRTYLLTIHVPFQPIAPRTVRLASDWARSLRLLRDSFGGQFHRFIVAAPAIPVDADWAEQKPVEFSCAAEGFEFVRLCQAGLRTRRFWPQAPAVYRRCRTLAAEATVVHTGMSDLFRPIGFLGFLAAYRAGVPTVFVEDNDVIAESDQMNADRHRWRWWFYSRMRSRLTRWVVARADLSLLKGPLLNARFSRFAKNARDFHDTSHSEVWVMPDAKVENKVDALPQSCTLRCVSVGRLISRKGLDESFCAIAAARRLGVPAELDVIGQGPDRTRLETMVRKLELGPFVKFLGGREYGKALIDELSQYHLMLFTSRFEETPRALFDAVAAAVPIAGYATAYVRSVIESESCGVLAPIGDAAGLAAQIRRLWDDRRMLIGLTRNAAGAGRRHAAERWYQRRAEWVNQIIASSGGQRNLPVGGEL